MLHMSEDHKYRKEEEKLQCTPFSIVYYNLHPFHCQKMSQQINRHRSFSELVILPGPTSPLAYPHFTLCSIYLVVTSC